MAVTQISNIIVPEVFAKYMIRETAERARIFQSGLLVSDGTLNSFLSGGGYSVKLPHWNDLWTSTTGDDDNNRSSDAATEATPANVTAKRDIALRHNRNKGWSSADLTAALAGDDPMQMIVSRTATYWANALERTFVSTIKGIVAENGTPTAGSTSTTNDMINDQSGAALTPEMIIDAAATMGDADDRLSVIIMHSKIYASLAKQNLIDFIPDSDGKVRFPSYMGYTVLRDDDVPVDTNVYDTYLVAKDAFAWGEGSARVPVETDRYPARGHGGGTEELWTRREFVMHPRGYSCVVADDANGQSPADSTLALSTSWRREALERKQIGIAVLKSLV